MAQTVLPAVFLAIAGCLFAQPRDCGADARQILDLLLAGKYADVVARFSPEMRKALSEDALKAGVGRIGAFGPVKKILAPEVNSVPEFDVVIVPVEFEKGAMTFQVTFNKSGEIAGMYFRPREATVPYERPAYSKPEQFRTEEVTIGSGEWKLPGTVALPAGKGLFPAVVLVHGSGPNDRDESAGGAKPFRDLAEGLASRGVAVLRYEKRTRVYGAKMQTVRDITVKQETIDDAALAAGLLRARPEIDPKRVFVLGHSLGGYLMPRIARATPEAAGLIILAGNTRPMEDLILEQVTYISSLAGNTSPEQEKQFEKLRESVARVKTLKPGDEVAQAELPLGVPASYWLDLKGYDPAAEARGINKPMLILQGERDYQVTAEDFGRWREALKARKDVRLRSYPSLNHLFVSGEGKSSPAEYSKLGHVAPDVIDEIVGWIAGVR